MGQRATAAATSDLQLTRTRYDRRTSLPVAIKIIDLESAEDEIDDIQQEIQILGQLDNDCMTRCVTCGCGRRWRGLCPSHTTVSRQPSLTPCSYYGSFLKGSHLWIIMEYCAGGSCSDLVGSCSGIQRLTLKMKAGTFKEEYIAILLRELLRGLEYLHGEGKLHRDIKGTHCAGARSRLC